MHPQTQNSPLPPCTAPFPLALLQRAACASCAPTFPFLPPTVVPTRPPAFPFSATPVCGRCGRVPIAQLTFFSHPASWIYVNAVTASCKKLTHGRPKAISPQRAHKSAAAACASTAPLRPAAACCCCCCCFCCFCSAAAPHAWSCVLHRCLVTALRLPGNDCGAGCLRAWGGVRGEGQTDRKGGNGMVGGGLGRSLNRSKVSQKPRDTKQSVLRIMGHV